MLSNSVIVQIFNTFGGILIFTSLLLAGIRLMYKNKNTEERTKAMTSIVYIMIGSAILGSLLLVSGYVIGLRNDIVSGINTGNITQNAITQMPELTQDDGNIFIRFITTPIDIINKFLEWLLTNISDFKPIDELIFNMNNSSAISKEEYTTMVSLYKLVISITTPLILIMIGKTGVQYIVYSGSINKRIELKQEIGRWFLSIAAIGIAPIILAGLMQMNNDIVSELLRLSGITTSKFVSISNNIVTNSILTTAIVKLLFLYVQLHINIIFLMRKIMITVMFVFTPIAAILWGINKKIAAAQIWFGEMITNIFMQSFYAFTLFIMMKVVADTTFQNWFYTLLWMFSIISISEMLRNSLQGLFTRLAGIDEASIAQKGIGTVGKMFAGTMGAMKATTSGFNAGSIIDKVYNGQRPSGNIYKNTGTQATAQPATSGAINNIGNMSSTINPEMDNGDINTGNISSIGNMLSMSGNILGATTSENIFAQNDKENPYLQMVKNKRGRYQVLDTVGKAEPYNKQWTENDKYIGMLTNNMNRHMMNRKDYGNAIGKGLNVMIGHDNAFSNIALGVGRGITNIQGRIITARAIKDTVKQMRKENPEIKTDKEAVEKLFGQSKSVNMGSREFNVNFNQLRFINSAGKSNIADAEKILIKNHPYTKANGFTWKM